jgi:hypothetical protein
VVEVAQGVEEGVEGTVAEEGLLIVVRPTLPLYINMGVVVHRYSFNQKRNAGGLLLLQFFFLVVSLLL